VAAETQTAAAERSERARHIVARLMEGRTTAEIAAAEDLSVRRVQQILREECERRRADPARDHALLQIARLERVVDRLGRQIDGGKTAAAPAFLRAIDMLSRMTRSPLNIANFVAPAEGVAWALESFARLDAAREIVAERFAAAAEAQVGEPAKREIPQVVENKRSETISDFAAQ
jgi:hypothetical protein